MPSRSRISPEIKSQILRELLDPGVLVPEVAKKYGYPAKRLYQWRSDHKKSIADNIDLSISPPSDFIEVVPAEEGLQDKIEATIKLNNISLCIEGDFSSAKLLEIIKILG